MISTAGIAVTSFKPERYFLTRLLLLYSPGTMSINSGKLSADRKLTPFPYLNTRRLFCIFLLQRRSTPSRK